MLLPPRSALEAVSPIVSRDWIVIYPTMHAENPAKTRSIILI